MTSHSRYSHHARRALAHAGTLVVRYRHPVMDTAHLLVGVMLAEGSIGSKVLRGLDLNARKAEPHLRALYGKVKAPEGGTGRAESLENALALAADESAWLGHHYIGTEHLLLGITRTNAGNASDLLHRLNATPEQLRRRVRQALKEGEQEFDLNYARRSARLSELSRRVINAAEQMALTLDHPTVGIGHLLLVLCQETRSPTAALLRANGLNEERLRRGLKKNDPLLLISIEPVLNRVSEEAEKVGDHYSGTEHLLLTLTLDLGGIALLQYYGLQPEALRRQLGFDKR